jgi:hypothetical protein
VLVRRVLPFALALATAGGITAAGLAGAASRAQVMDPNDTDGVLDVRRIWFEPEVHPPRWTIVTFAPWMPEQARDQGFVFVYLDTVGSPRPDYYALIRSTGHRISGSLWRDATRGPDVRITGLDVRRDSDLTVAVRIPLGGLDVGTFRTTYGWSVVSTFAGRVCRATCIDRVPDVGVFEQPIGTSTPTTTPTPTPTPTSTPTDAHSDRVADALIGRR